MRAFAVLALVACQEPTPAVADSGGPAADSATPAADCADATATWDAFGEGFFTTWCQACHSRTTPQRAGAPAGVDFDTPADLVTWGPAIERSVLVDGTMPLGGGIGADDRARLAELLRCGP